MQDGTRHDETGRVRWAADRIDGVLTVVEEDRATGVVAIFERDRGVCRYRELVATVDGWATRIDATFETPCSVEPVELLEELPVLQSRVPARCDMPGPARAGFGPSSRGSTHLHLVADDDREAA